MFLATCDAHCHVDCFVCVVDIFVVYAAIGTKYIFSLCVRRGKVLCRSHHIERGNCFLNGMSRGMYVLVVLQYVRRDNIIMVIFCFVCYLLFPSSSPLASRVSWQQATQRGLGKCVWVVASRVHSFATALCLSCRLARFLAF